MPARTKKITQEEVRTPAKRTAVQASLDEIDDEEINLAAETIEDIALALSTCDGAEVARNNKRLKPLRAAIHSFTRATVTATAGTLTSRISDALSEGRWTDARVLLAEFKIRQQHIKLGTLQRWVRDVDAATASGLSDPANAEIFRVLDAILRASGASPTTSDGINASVDPVIDAPDSLKEGSDAGVIRFEPTVAFSEISGLQLREEVLTGKIYESSQRSNKEDWSRLLNVVEVTPAAKRKPPNQYDATIYTTTQPILSTFSSAVKRHDIPAVPGAFVLENLLSADECRAIIGLGESVGFSPDRAVGGSAVQQAS